MKVSILRLFRKLGWYKGPIHYTLNAKPIRLFGTIRALGT